MKLSQFEETLFGSQDSLDRLPENGLLDYYKLCIVSTEQISQRRQSANGFFLTINTVLISFLSYVNIGEQSKGMAFIAISLSGIALCFVWYRLLVSYRQLNSAKFKVILSLENRMPVKMYGTEWKELGEGKDSSIHKPFTSLEIFVPLIFMALHLLVVILKITSL